MRLNITLVISIIAAVGLVAFGFTFYQINDERTKLNNELEVRARQVVDDILKSKTFLYEKIGQENIEYAEDTLRKKYNLMGLAIYFNDDSIVSSYSSRRLIKQSLDYVSQAIAADTTLGVFITVEGRQVYQYVKPVTRDDVTNHAIVFYTDAGYIENIISSIWLRNFIRWFLQALFVSVITIAIVRWGVFSPVNKIAMWVKAARLGNIEQLSNYPPVGFLQPLHKEIIDIAKAMREARASAEEEARLRTSAEAIWTPERLKAEVENLLDDRLLVVVSNREPYMHIHEGKRIECIVPASGMITAMEPILKACGGLWLASGTGDADKETVDANDKVQVPPQEPKYTLKRLWLSKKEEDHFYYGFSNEGLWPLCHIAHTRPVFRKEDWDYYRQVNEKFAKSVLEEIDGKEAPFILIQDYHFALLPQLIKKARPDARIALFWHIPWPNPESFGICPWQRDILLGMLGADLVGFHTQYHCNHFLQTVNKAVESRVLWESFSVKIGSQTTLVKPFPISIAFTLKDYDELAPSVKPAQLLEEFGISAEYMGIGVDRIDYTKGIVEKFLAIERFLEKNPEYIGKFTFVQIGAPSRTLLKTYADVVSAVENEANRINWRFKHKNWRAILLLKRHHSHNEIKPFYAAANFCMVTSLHDGMNLVAKEFVATRHQNTGALILSRFAGASQELQGALIVNPYDTEKSAEAIKAAVEMPAEEQYRRMKQMRNVIVEHNIYGWAAGLLRTMATLQ